MEGKWIHQHNPARFAYVSGSGSWVVTRPTAAEETDLIPTTFSPELDAEMRTPTHAAGKIGFRDICKSSDERTLISAEIPPNFPCGHQLPTLSSSMAERLDMDFVESWSSSFLIDFHARFLSNGHVTATLLSLLPGPVPDAMTYETLRRISASSRCQRTAQERRNEKGKAIDR